MALIALALVFLTLGMAIATVFVARGKAAGLLCVYLNREEVQRHVIDICLHQPHPEPPRSQGNLAHGQVPGRVAGRSARGQVVQGRVLAPLPARGEIPTTRGGQLPLDAFDDARRPIYQLTALPQDRGDGT